MSKNRRILSFALAFALVVSITPARLNESQAEESADALSRLQALAAAYPQGVPAVMLRASLREIVDRENAAKQKALCLPTPSCPCSKQPGCRPSYLSGPTRPDLDTSRPSETLIRALKAFERETHNKAGTISAMKFRALLSNLEMASAAAQK